MCTLPLTPSSTPLSCRYDHDHDGRLTRPEFEGLLNDYLRSKQQQPPPSNHTTTTNNSPPAQPAPLPPPPQPLPPAEPPLAPRALPSEVTHYNESTGVPLPADVVLRYQSAYGHKVLPIAQAFERRMHTLQVSTGTGGRGRRLGGGVGAGAHACANMCVSSLYSMWIYSD
jgi:hypothetical protein